MSTEMDPVVNNWYRDLDSERVFEVVAIDEDDGTVEIQYFESELEELDIDSWYEMNLEFAAAPEDWSGPYDDLTADDFGDTGEGYHPESWNNPTDEIEGGIDYE